MGDFSAALGQSFFQRKLSSFNGNASGNLALATRLNEARSIMASYSGQYGNFVNTEQLVGGGYLFQQSMTHQVNISGVMPIKTKINLEPRLGIKRGFFNETKDEPWSKGLFDYRRINLGTDLFFGDQESNEYMSLGYDFFQNTYPNFKDNLGARFGQELAQEEFNPGSKLLDSVDHQLSLGSAFSEPSEDKTGRYDLFLIQRLYEDQKIINQDGTYAAKKRRDLTFTLSKTRFFTDRRKKESEISLTYLDSNQNHLDANLDRLKFIPDYYDYAELTWKPLWGFRKQPPYLQLSNEVILRGYLGRDAQKSGGEYSENKTVTLSDNLELRLGAPIGGGWAWQIAMNIGFGLSNNFYKAPYTYNYFLLNYFGGLAWRF